MQKWALCCNRPVRCELLDLQMASLFPCCCVIRECSVKENVHRKTHMLKADRTPSNFLKAVFYKFYLVHSWILCFIWKVFCTFNLGRVFTRWCNESVQNFVNTCPQFSLTVEHHNLPCYLPPNRHHSKNYQYHHNTLFPSHDVCLKYKI